MRRFEFRVRQYPIAAGTHSWEANELESPCDPIPLPEGERRQPPSKVLLENTRRSKTICPGHMASTSLSFTSQVWTNFRSFLTKATNGHFVVRGPRSSCMIFLGSSQV